MGNESMNWIIRLSLLGSLALTGIACTDDTEDEIEEAPNAANAAYLADNFGIYLDGFEPSDEFIEDGVAISTAEGLTWVEDNPAREIAIRQEVFPAAEGGDLVLNITDIETGVSRYFLYNAESNFR